MALAQQYAGAPRCELHAPCALCVCTCACLCVRVCVGYSHLATLQPFSSPAPCRDQRPTFEWMGTCRSVRDSVFCAKQPGAICVPIPPPQRHFTPIHRFLGVAGVLVGFTSGDDGPDPKAQEIAEAEVRPRPKGPFPSQSVRAGGGRGGVASPAPAFTAWNLPLFMLRSFCLSCPGKRFRRGATPTTSTSTPTMSAPARVRCGASQPSVLRRSTGGRCTRRRAATATRSARSSSQPVSPAIALITTFIVVVIVHND